MQGDPRLTAVASLKQYSSEQAAIPTKYRDPRLTAVASLKQINVKRAMPGKGEVIHG